MSGIERGDRPFFPSDDDTLGDPPGPLGHVERVAELEAEEGRVRQFMALPTEERRQILEEHYRQHPELLDQAAGDAMSLDPTL